MQAGYLGSTVKVGRGTGTPSCAQEDLTEALWEWTAKVLVQEDSWEHPAHEVAQHLFPQVYCLGPRVRDQEQAQTSADQVRGQCC